MFNVLAFPLRVLRYYIVSLIALALIAIGLLSDAFTDLAHGWIRWMIKSLDLCVLYVSALAVHIYCVCTLLGVLPNGVYIPETWMAVVGAIVSYAVPLYVTLTVQDLKYTLEKLGLR